MEGAAMAGLEVVLWQPLNWMILNSRILRNISDIEEEQLDHISPQKDLTESLPLSDSSYQLFLSQFFRLKK